MIAIPPARFEFGLQIRYHVPAVYAMGRPLVVCIEPGMEALYPKAEHLLVQRRPDTERKDLYGKDRVFVRMWVERLRELYPGCRIEMPERYETHRAMRRFIPQPFVRQGVGKAQVVLCPRKREVGPERNWPGWSALSTALAALGYSTFAAGKRETSDLSAVAHWHAWDYDRELDATIEAMLSASLVVSTDAGLAHLAILCGRPLLLVGHGKLPAPGARWEIRLQEYYQNANHQQAPISIEGGGWYDPAVVVRRIHSFLEY